MGKIKKKIKKKLLKIFAGKERFQPFFEVLHEFSLAGLHLGGGDNVSNSGEKNVIAYLDRHIDKAMHPVIFDVGANDGSYAKEVLSTFKERARLYCFEPSKKAFGALSAAMAGCVNVEVHNFGYGQKEETVSIYADFEGSKLGSIFPARANSLGIGTIYKEEIRLKRLDEFCSEHKIAHIDLLKIDVEGGELEVLKGAGTMLNPGTIGMVQFEFGPCNVSSRTFFQDFYRLLDPGYRIFRVLKDGFRAVDCYKESHEVFMTTNYLAVSMESRIKKG